MKKILLIGAGRSSSQFIDHLSRNRELELKIVDGNSEAIAKLKSRYPEIQVESKNIMDKEIRSALVQEADVVVSLLPADLHPLVAKDCLNHKKHFFTASYVPAEMEEWQDEISDKGLFWLNECGLDPGIDHMSACRAINKLKSEGAEIKEFYSHTGGLMEYSENENPWNYKITWNPHNVVGSGKDGAYFKRDGKNSFVPYHRIFSTYNTLDIHDTGTFDVYFNRNSVQYVPLYGLENAETVIRGTLRYSGFCATWQKLVDMGMTHSNIKINFKNTSMPEFMSLFLDSSLYKGETVESRIIRDFQLTGLDVQKFHYLGLFNEELKLNGIYSPADVLIERMVDKITIKEGERDRIVMYHQLDYDLEGERKSTSLVLDAYGDDEATAMAKTVGLPLAIALEKFLEGKIKLKGLHRPTRPEIYEPVLNEFEAFGIGFQHKED